MNKKVVLLNNNKFKRKYNENLDVYDDKLKKKRKRYNIKEDIIIKDIFIYYKNIIEETELIKQGNYKSKMLSKNGISINDIFIDYDPFLENELFTKHKLFSKNNLIEEYNKNKLLNF